MMEQNKKPDFVCIGPEKTGTNWLFSALKNHPEIYLPPIQELRYLNEGGIIPAHSLKMVIYSKNWHYVQLRERLQRLVKQCFTRNIISSQWRREFLWNLYYILGKHSFGWYGNLFIGGRKRIAGDISPLYYHIAMKKIQELASHNPHCKIIVFVRDPVERSWSKAKMNLMKHKKKNYDEVSTEEFIEIFDHIKKGWIPYNKTIGMWQSNFENVHVGIFDALQKAPDKFYEAVCKFLRIDWAVPKNYLLDKIVNRGIDLEIPEKFKLYLVEQYKEEIKDWCSESNFGYKCRWDERYNL